MLKPLLDFIFPRVCHICGLRLSASERYVCTSCLSRLPRTLYHRQPDNPMEQRFMGLFPYERATGHFFYSRGSDVARLVADMKYHGFRGLARHLGSLVADELLPTGFLNDLDMILPVPMHFFKQARRGYNQAFEIARGVSETAGIRLATNLKAVRGHRTQTSKTLQQRRTNTAGIFRLMRPDEVDGRSVLLLDDVCTTGSTLTSAADAILADAPNTKLTLLTVGVTF